MAVLALLFWAALSIDAPGPPDLRPVMPEADGVHLVTARLALSSAYAPGEGWLHKYPPLGLAVFGLAAGTAGGSWLTEAYDVPTRPASSVATSATGSADAGGGTPSKKKLRVLYRASGEAHPKLRATRKAAVAATTRPRRRRPIKRPNDQAAFGFVRTAIHPSSRVRIH